MNKEKKFIERKIKGNINETIVEFMLKDLGFYVIKLGQEHKVEPIVQLQNYFIKQDSNFNIFTNIRKEDGFEQIRSLPDFLVVKDKYRPLLLEAKYRTEGLYIDDNNKCKRLDELFKFYPNSFLLLTCKNYNYLKNRAFYRLSNNFDISKRNLETHFFVFYKEKENYFWCSLEKWLENYIGFSYNKIKNKLLKYEMLVDKWF
jgi:hypothetical protein